MITLAVSAELNTRPECPKCKNRDGIRDNALSVRLRQRAYDILTDSWGLLRCPKCRHRGGWAEFHKATRVAANENH